MKPNKLTHGHNLMWESSRMMLPEHKELLQQHHQRINRKEKPQFDEQEVNWLEGQIHEAISKQQPVKITLFNPDYDQTITGLIQKIDVPTKQIKIQQPYGESDWINFNDILKIE